MIAAMTATKAPTKTITPTIGRSVAATKMAPSAPKTTTIQIAFFTNSLPTRCRRCPSLRMAIASFTGASYPLLVTSQR
jgi:hypothetical protein